MSTTRLLRAPLPRRVAVLSIHTSPLDQPGTGEALVAAVRAADEQLAFSP